MTKEAWQNDHDLTTPWGFSLNEAFAALSFRTSVRSDTSAFNEYSNNRESVYSMFSALHCKMYRCESLVVKRAKMPDFKGKEYLKITDSFCEEHYRKLWDLRWHRKLVKEERRRRYEEWAREQKQREFELYRRVERERNMERWADEQERKTQAVDLRGIRTERANVLRSRKKRYKGPARTGYVYWLYDRVGTLLYVGKTYSVEKRLFGQGGHAHTKPWWSEVVSVKVETYKDEAEALIAEARLIRGLRPLHNKALPLPGTDRVPEVLEVNYYGKELTCLTTTR